MQYFPPKLNLKKVKMIQSSVWSLAEKPMAPLLKQTCLNLLEKLGVAPVIGQSFDKRH